MEKTTMQSKESIKITKILLTCGSVAGPLYLIVGLIQIALNPGFNIMQHPWSLLALSSTGWIQSINFLLTGYLFIAGAIGMKRALQSGRGSTFAPLMLGLYGVGLIASAIFRTDPALGFPPGTPMGMHPFSSHAVMHLVVSSIGFIGLVATCFIFASRFKTLKQAGWRKYSMVSGIIFLLAFIAVSSLPQGSGILFAAAVFGFIYFFKLFTYLKSELTNKV